VVVEDFFLAVADSPLDDGMVGRLLRRVSRASAPGLIGILEMEDVWIDSATSEALQHLCSASAGATLEESWTDNDFLDELSYALDNGYRLGRILLGTVMLRPDYTLTDHDTDANLIRLLAFVKLVSTAEIEQLLTGAAREAVDQLAAPLLTRRGRIRKLLGPASAIDVVYDGFYDGVKLALSEEVLFELLRTGTLT
jgi:hypothetical protein